MDENFSSCQTFLHFYLVKGNKFTENLQYTRDIAKIIHFRMDSTKPELRRKDPSGPSQEHLRLKVKNILPVFFLVRDFKQK